MKRCCWLAVALAAILVPVAAGAQVGSAGLVLGIDQSLAGMLGLEPGFGRAPMSQLSPLASVVPNDQQEIFAKVVRWKKLTIVALGINTGAILVAFIEPFVGNILGILSLGFYTISAGYMAFGYRDLMAAQSLTAEAEPNPRSAFMASVIAAGFGMGALTALGFAFESEAALVLGMACTAVSGVSGVIAVVRTNAYGRLIDHDSYARRLQQLRFQKGLEGPAAGEKPRFRLAVPLMRWDY